LIGRLKYPTGAKSAFHIEQQVAGDRGWFRGRDSKQYLERAGFSVLTAGDGIEALTLFEEHQSLALLLTDVIMPEMNGLRLADAV
jgi:PleD family two-component response regulator